MCALPVNAVLFSNLLSMSRAYAQLAPLRAMRLSSTSLPRIPVVLSRTSFTRDELLSSLAARRPIRTTSIRETSSASAVEVSDARNP